MMMMNVILTVLLITICQTLDHQQCKHTLWLVGGHHVGLPVSLLANFLIHHHPHLHNHLPNNIAIQLGKDMRMKSREAPSTDLGDWMEGKVFFDCIVEEQRADDALMSGANEEEEWRAVWREERMDMGERPEE